MHFLLWEHNSFWNPSALNITHKTVIFLFLHTLPVYCFFLCTILLPFNFPLRISLILSNSLCYFSINFITNFHFSTSTVHLIAPRLTLIAWVNSNLLLIPLILLPFIFLILVSSNYNINNCNRIFILHDVHAIFSYLCNGLYFKPKLDEMPM